jgi:hypothetical protein
MDPMHVGKDMAGWEPCALLVRAAKGELLGETVGRILNKRFPNRCRHVTQKQHSSTHTESWTHVHARRENWAHVHAR